MKSLHLYLFAILTVISFCSNVLAQKVFATDSILANNYDAKFEFMMKIIKGNITLYDSTYKIMSLEKYYAKHKWKLEQVTVDDFGGAHEQPNRVKFLSTFQYGIHDGYGHIWLSYNTGALKASNDKRDSSFIRFNLVSYNEDGTYRSEKNFFLTKRNPVEVDIKHLTLTKLINQHTHDDKHIIALLKNTNDYWRNDWIMLSGIETEIDRCQKNYQLQLLNDNEYYQSYSTIISNDDSIEYRSGNEYDKKYQSKTMLVGTDYGYKFGEKEHEVCYLANKNGFWTIHDQHLQLITHSGVVIVDYIIKSFDKNTMILSTNDYTIQMKRVKL